MNKNISYNEKRRYLQAVDKDIRTIPIPQNITYKTAFFQIIIMTLSDV